MNSEGCDEETTPQWAAKMNYCRICFTLTMPLHCTFLTLDWAVDHRAGYRAQHHPAAGGGSFPAGSPEQGAETEVAGTRGNHQVQVQILHHHTGSQDCSAGRTARHRVKVSAVQWMLRNHSKQMWMAHRKPELFFCDLWLPFLLYLLWLWL